MKTASLKKSSSRVSSGSSSTPNFLMLRLLFLGTGLVFILFMVTKNPSHFRSQERYPKISDELQELILGLSQPPYRDPGQLFTMVPPTGWKKKSVSNSDPYNVIFESPNGPDIRIIATRVDQSEGMPVLAKRIEQIEKEHGIEMNIDVTTFGGRTAIKRETTLQKLKLFVIDFVENQVSHHLQFSAHPLVYDRYLPVVMQILETYEPEGLLREPLSSHGTGDHDHLTTEQ